MTGDHPVAPAPAPAPPKAAPPDPRPPGPRRPATELPDADPPDTGPSDASGPGPSDAGELDAGPADAGRLDVGPSDTPLDIGPAEIDPPAVCVSGSAEARLLIRTQLRIALGTCAVVLTVVTGLPVLLAAVPAVARARVHGLPLWWLVLALGVQPLWIVVSRRQLRRAERAERDLAGPVGGP